jgi:hypothetical protein
MPAARYPYFFSIADILVVLRQASEIGSSLSAEEIWEELLRPHSRPRSAWSEIINAELRDLSALGLVEIDANAPEDGSPRWRCGAAWDLKISRGEGDNGRFDRNPPPPGNDEGDNEGGAGGLREVLSHPVLFALSAADFETVLQAAVGTPE